MVQGPLYGDFLESLIQDWRGRWGRPDLPFGIVQIAPFGDGRKRAEYAEVRDVHPRRKRPVGERLAGWALH